MDMDVRSEYSSNVQLRLVANGRSWPVAKLGPDHFVPSERLELLPCDAEIIMTVDGDERRWNVRIVEGACIFKTVVKIRYQTPLRKHSGRLWD